jgi:hypothetical protein
MKFFSNSYSFSDLVVLMMQGTTDMFVFTDVNGKPQIFRATGNVLSNITHSITSRTYQHFNSAISIKLKSNVNVQFFTDILIKVLAFIVIVYYLTPIH